MPVMIAPQNALEVDDNESQTASPIQSLVNEYPLIMLNMALLVGVTLGWLAKRR